MGWHFFIPWLNNGIFLFNQNIIPCTIIVKNDGGIGMVKNNEFSSINIVNGLIVVSGKSEYENGGRSKWQLTLDRNQLGNPKNQFCLIPPLAEMVIYEHGNSYQLLGQQDIKSKRIRYRVTQKIWSGRLKIITGETELLLKDKF